MDSCLSNYPATNIRVEDLLFDNTTGHCACIHSLQVFPRSSRFMIAHFKESPLGQGEEMESREREEEECNEEGDRDKMLALRVRWRERGGKKTG